MRSRREEMLKLLQELVACHSPSGDEREIEPVIERHFRKHSEKVWQDDATNLVAHLPGRGPKIVIAAHKDEIGMVITRVREDGRLEVENCGGSFAWKYGEGPVEIIADDGSLVEGLLSVGSIHTKSGPLHELQSSRALTWDLVTIFTGFSISQLEDRGVHVGSRAVVARERKALKTYGDYIASFALDDRMGLVSLIFGLQELSTIKAKADLYFIATHGEEIGMNGAMRAAQLIRPDLFIALDTSPIVKETPLVLDGRPVIWYREATYNDKTECDKLLVLAKELGFGAQPCVFPRAGSDAGRIKQAGLAGRTVCFGFPRDNSHGFEIADPDSLLNVTRLLVEYIQRFS